MARTAGENERIFDNAKAVVSTSTAAAAPLADPKKLA